MHSATYGAAMIALATIAGIDGSFRSTPQSPTPETTMPETPRTTRRSPQGHARSEQRIADFGGVPRHPSMARSLLQ